MITKTGLEKIDRILKKSGKKVDGFFFFSRLWTVVGRLQLGCQFVLGSLGGRSDCRFVLNSVGRSELSFDALLGSLAQVGGLDILVNTD